MTTMVKILACCTANKEVHVVLGRGEAETLTRLENGDEHLVYIYDDWHVDVHEVVKSENGPPEYQVRVVAEKKELDEKLAKLYNFFQCATFRALSEVEQTRLRSQARFMDGYSAVLGERILAFSGDGRVA